MAVICLSPDHPVFCARARAATDPDACMESKAADGSDLLLPTTLVREVDPGAALAQVIYNTMTAVDVDPLSVRDALGLLAGGDDNLTALMQALDESLPVSDAAFSRGVAPGTITRRVRRAVELQSRLAGSGTRLHDLLDRATVSFQKMLPAVRRRIEAMRLECPETAAMVQKRWEAFLVALADVQCGLALRIGRAKFEERFENLLRELGKMSPNAIAGIDLKPIRGLLTMIGATLQQFHCDLGKLRELLPQLRMGQRLRTKTRNGADPGFEPAHPMSKLSLDGEIFALFVARACDPGRSCCLFGTLSNRPHRAGRFFCAQSETKG